MPIYYFVNSTSLNTPSKFENVKNRILKKVQESGNSDIAIGSSATRQSLLSDAANADQNTPTCFHTFKKLADTLQAKYYDLTLADILSCSTEQTSSAQQIFNYLGDNESYSEFDIKLARQLSPYLKKDTMPWDLFIRRENIAWGKLFEDNPLTGEFSEKFIKHSLEDHPLINCPLSVLNEQDSNKIIWLFTQAHYLAQQKPNEQISIVIIERDKDIANALVKYYKMHPQLLPKNINVTIEHYDSNQADAEPSSNTIKGIGEFNSRFREITYRYLFILRQNCLKHDEKAAKECSDFAIRVKILGDRSDQTPAYLAFQVFLHRCATYEKKIKSLPVRDPKESSSSANDIQTTPISIPTILELQKNAEAALTKKRPIPIFAQLRNYCEELVEDLREYQDKNEMPENLQSVVVDFCNQIEQLQKQNFPRLQETKHFIDLDADGSASKGLNNKDALSEQIPNQHPKLLSFIGNIKETAEQITLASFSNRQGFDRDANNSANKKEAERGLSFFSVLDTYAELVGAKADLSTTADILFSTRNQTPTGQKILDSLNGITYSEDDLTIGAEVITGYISNELLNLSRDLLEDQSKLREKISDSVKGTPYENKFAASLLKDCPITLTDEFKIILLWIIIQAAVDTDEDSTLIRYPIDDRKDILDNILKFFRNNPELIPSNVLIKPTHYDANGAPIVLGTIRGEGVFNPRYRQIARDYLLLINKKSKFSNEETEEIMLCNDFPSLVNQYAGDEFGELEKLFKDFQTKVLQALAQTKSAWFTPWIFAEPSDNCYHTLFGENSRLRRMLSINFPTHQNLLEHFQDLLVEILPFINSFSVSRSVQIELRNLYCQFQGFVILLQCNLHAEEGSENKLSSQLHYFYDTANRNVMQESEGCQQIIAKMNAAGFNVPYNSLSLQKLSNLAVEIYDIAQTRLKAQYFESAATPLYQNIVAFVENILKGNFSTHLTMPSSSSSSHDAQRPALSM